MAIQYLRVAEVTSEDRLDELFYQLNNESCLVNLQRINALIREGKYALYFAVLDGKPVGMVSVISCKTASFDKMYIEDVAVLDEVRGKGIGRALLEFAMKDAATLFGPGTFWLTSRPSRIAARAMYVSMGFVEYDTGVFKNEQFL